MTRVDILPVLAECYYYNRKGSTIIRLEVVLGYRGDDIRQEAHPIHIVPNPKAYLILFSYDSSCFFKCVT